MAKVTASVDEYLAAQTPEARAVLARVRATIKKALPRATERISYRIPTYDVALKKAAGRCSLRAMKRFLAIYVGTAAALEKWRAMPEAERKTREAAGMEAWIKWGKDNAAAIVDMGSPLGKTKRAASGGITDTKNEIGGYVIVQAESHEAAAKLFEGHPHFTKFPGEAVEIMECLPMPV